MCFNLIISPAPYVSPENMIYSKLLSNASEFIKKQRELYATDKNLKYVNPFVTCNTLYCL